MKSSTPLIVALMCAALTLGACKKPTEPSTPTNPDPKAEAQATDPNAPGTTTNFETPAPAAEPAKQ